MKTTNKMKYTSPTIDIYQLELQQMLATSTILDPSVDDPSVIISGDTEDSGFFSAHDGEDFSFFEEEEFKF